MKIKVLECPAWVRYADQFQGAKQALIRGYEEIQPLFQRDGLYLINTTFVVMECGGRAWVGKDSHEDVETFTKDLKWAEYRNVSFLSWDQANALGTLAKARLATAEQLSLLSMHRSRREARVFGLKLRKRVRSAEPLESQDAL